MRDLCVIALVAAYIAVAAFTAGFAARTSCHEPGGGTGTTALGFVFCGLPAGIIWPVYWSAYAGSSAGIRSRGMTS